MKECVCVEEWGDRPCEVHDLYGDDPPGHVLEWHEFLKTVVVRGPIPCRFRIHKSRDGLWILESMMFVPNREDGNVTLIRFMNELKDNGADKRLVVRQRVLGMFQHEALESIFMDGQRAFDPHEARWYSNLVTDWRYNV